MKRTVVEKYLAAMTEIALEFDVIIEEPVKIIKDFHIECGFIYWDYRKEKYEIFHRKQNKN